MRTITKKPNKLLAGHPTVTYAERLQQVVQDIIGTDNLSGVSVLNIVMVEGDAVTITAYQRNGPPLTWTEQPDGTFERKE